MMTEEKTLYKKMRTLNLLCPEKIIISDGHERSVKEVYRDVSFNRRSQS